MGSKGVLRKNYYIYPETVAEFGTEIECVMTETDRVMEEASEIIAEIASLTERVPSQIRSSELLELCETAQAEIRSFDFLSYGKRVNQGLQNLLDQNQYITENFIGKMRGNTERMCKFGAECRRLTELIDYSGGSLPFRGIALSAVSNAESENSDDEEENDSNLSRDDAFIRAGVEETLEVSTSEVMAQVRYINNLRSGQNVLSNYMVNHGIGNDEEIRGFINWITEKRPGLLIELYVVDSKSSRDAVNVIDNLLEYYDLYRAELGANILEDFLNKNSENTNEEQKPELIVPFLYFFYSDKLIELYEIEDILEREENCRDLIEFYITQRDNDNIRLGKMFYAYTWWQINNIESYTHDDDMDFEQIVDKFVDAYYRNISIYSKIAEETGMLPEVIAVIHYRENSDDCIKGIFRANLINGAPLVGIDGMSDEERINFFIETAVDVINNQISNGNTLERYNPSGRYNDIIAMVCFMEAYNGLGYYSNDLISPYSYSGTNIYESGKYVEDENGNSYFDEDQIDEQVGSYRLLVALINRQE